MLYWHCDARHGIGKDNALPNWKIKGDLERVKKITTGSKQCCDNG